MSIIRLNPEYQPIGSYASQSDLTALTTRVANLEKVEIGLGYAAVPLSAGPSITRAKIPFTTGSMSSTGYLVAVQLASVPSNWTYIYPIAIVSRDKDGVTVDITNEGTVGITALFWVIAVNKMP